MAVMVITMTAGTTLIMWLGELITDRGIGNGMSLLIFTSIVANFPSRCGRSRPTTPTPWTAGRSSSASWPWAW